MNLNLKNSLPTLKGNISHLAVVTDDGKILSTVLSRSGEKNNLIIGFKIS